MIVFIALLFLTMIGVFIYLGLETRASGIQSTIKRWEIWYYVFSIFGSAGTVSAVFLALFKEEILQKLNSPELIIKPFEQVHLTSRKNAHGEVLFYEYCLKIENKGPKPATGVGVIYEDFKYDIRRLGNAFDAVDIPDNAQLVSDASIPAGESMSVQLFSVPNPNIDKSPEGNRVDASILFAKMKIEEKATYSALFQIKCKIRANDAKEQFAKCEVNWSGVWDDDKEKMQKNIIIKSL